MSRIAAGGRGSGLQRSRHGLIRNAAAALALLAAALPAAPSAAAERLEKIALWDNASGPHLRGVNVSQRRFYPGVDGEAFLGPPPAGPPYEAEDFAAIAALGANAVMLDHPGPFAEAPPYRFEPAMLAHLEQSVELAAAADLFVVIAFRTGPGRSVFSFHRGSAGTWFDESLFDDHVWASREAQEAWVAMWRHTAAHFRGHPAVIGYELMLEPNSSSVGSDVRKDRLNIDDPAVFHRRYGGSLYDWNQLYPRIVAAIREVDPEVPLLIGGNGYSSLAFLPYVAPLDDARSVYVVHDYEPWRYTHQKPADRRDYPGRFDVDWDGRAETVDRRLLERLLAPVDAFRRRRGAPVAVTEFGVSRWAPGAARFLTDQMAAFERLGMNHFLYFWQSAHPPVAALANPFAFRYGADPDQRGPIANPMVEATREAWSRNRLRPSTVEFVGSAP